MKEKTDLIDLEGIVIDTLPGAKFKVKLENDHEVLCTLSGKMRQNKISILKGDSVDIEVSPYDLTKGRITYRNK